MKTTMTLDDSLYQRAKVLAAQRGTPVSSLIEDALRLILADSDSEPSSARVQLPTWSMGTPLIDIDESRVLRETLDAGLGANALR